MWLPSLSIALGIWMWIAYEQAGIRIAECHDIKKRIPTRQIAMEDQIYSLRSRRTNLRFALIIDLIFLLALWAHHLWG